MNRRTPVYQFRGFKIQTQTRLSFNKFLLSTGNINKGMGSSRDAGPTAPMSSRKCLDRPFDCPSTPSTLLPLNLKSIFTFFFFIPN